MTITAPTTAPVTSYVGQTWYDLMGTPLEETGHNSPQLAAERIATIDRHLAGKWAFALIKIRTQENGVDQWTNTVIFPDGKKRKLIKGEVAISQRSKGKWITLDEAKKSIEAAKLSVELRLAPDTRFPWHHGAVETKMERFANMVEFEGWLAKNARKDAIVFIFVPGSSVRPPDEDMLITYLAVVTK